MGTEYDEDAVIWGAETAFLSKKPEDFLRFLRKYRRSYDSRRVKEALDELERRAREG